MPTARLPPGLLTAPRDPANHDAKARLNPAPTPTELRAAIDAIVEEQRRSASASPYDWKVCVMAVGAAAAALDRVPVEGTDADYAANVLAVLTALRDAYDDQSGEHTNGSSEIGSIVAKVARLTRGDTWLGLRAR